MLQWFISFAEFTDLNEKLQLQKLQYSIKKLSLFTDNEANTELHCIRGFRK